MILLGVAVWGLYAILRFGLGWGVAPGWFLPFHLAGVIPGVCLRRLDWLSGIIERRRR